MAITRFADVPRFPCATYEVSLDLRSVPRWIRQNAEDRTPLDKEPGFQH